MLEKDIADVDTLNLGHCFGEVVNGRNRLLVESVERGFGHSAVLVFSQTERQCSIENLLLFLGAWVIEAMTKHESVKLRFGQFKSAALFNRILRRNDKKRSGQMKAVIPDGYPALLHGFEQRALDFGRGAINFVCQKQVGKDRTAVGAKFPCALVENFGT